MPASNLLAGLLLAAAAAPDDPVPIRVECYVIEEGEIYEAVPAAAGEKARPAEWRPITDPERFQTKAIIADGELGRPLHVWSRRGRETVEMHFVAKPGDGGKLVCDIRLKETVKRGREQGSIPITDVNGVNTTRSVSWNEILTIGSTTVRKEENTTADRKRLFEQSFLECRILPLAEDSQRDPSGDEEFVAGRPSPFPPPNRRRDELRREAKKEPVPIPVLTPNLPDAGR